MRRRNKKAIVAAAGVGALFLAGAAAFTNNLVDSTSTHAPVAYGSLHTSNVTVTSVSYTLSGANPAVVTAVTFGAQGDTHVSTAQVGFNGSGTMNVVGCTGTYDGTSTTTYACTLSTTELVSVITETDIALTPGA